jgi:hypothetical protein
MHGTPLGTRMDLASAYGIEALDEPAMWSHCFWSRDSDQWTMPSNERMEQLSAYALEEPE